MTAILKYCIYHAYCNYGNNKDIHIKHISGSSFFQINKSC